MDASNNHSGADKCSALQAATATQCLQFLDHCCQSITENATTRPVLAGAARLREALNKARSIPCASRSVAIIETVSSLDQGLYIDQFKSLSPTLPWKPSTRSDDDGRQMALASFNEMLELGDVACGLMYVGAGFEYPEHQHNPQELYLVLSGGAKWRFGGAQDFCELDAGAIIYNKPWDWHGVKSGDSPLLALYVLWPDLDED